MKLLPLNLTWPVLPINKINCKQYTLPFITYILVLVSIRMCLTRSKYLTRISPSNLPPRHLLIKTLDPTWDKNDIHMIIEGVDKIPHMIKSVPQGLRFSHIEHQIRSKFLRSVSSNVVAYPEGVTLPHTWLIRIVKPRSPVATCYDSCH